MNNIIYSLIILLFSYSANSSEVQTNQSQIQKYIYLSFDDGPLNGSQRINDALLTEKIPITVMLVGEHALVRPQDVELYKKNEFIEVGNHSYSHANNHYKLYYSNPTGVLNDFIRNKDALKLDDKIGRLPGRNMWRRNGRSKNDISSGIEAADLLAKNGFSLFGWDLEWRHDSHTGEPIGTAEDIFNQIEKMLDENRTFTDSHIVLLSHDEMFQHQYEESELKKLIDLLKSRGDYKFSRLKNYP
jgi:peptidoglycan/xylan/chitin deacetylase (PgdA/CDA1 family)